MMKVYWMLLSRILRLCFNGLLIALVTGLVLHSLGLNISAILLETAMFGMVGGLILGPFIVGSSSWVFHIPIKRTQLFTLAALANFSGYIAAFAVTNLALMLASLLNKGNLDLYFQLRKSVWGFFGGGMELAGGLFEFAQILLLLNLFFICWHMIALVFTRNRTRGSKGLGKPSAKNNSPEKTRKIIVGLVLGSLLVMKFHPYLWFGLSMSVAMVLGSSLLMFELFLRSSGVFGETALNWRSVGWVIGAFEVALIVGLTIISINSLSLTKRIDAHFFLGGWAPKDRNTLAEFLGGETSYQQIDQLGAEYQEEYNGGKWLSASDKDGLQLDQLIQTKKTPQQLYSVFKMFDPKTFTSAQLTPMFEKSNGVFDLNKRTFTRYAVPASLDVSEVISYIDSPNLLMAQYGLLRARYFPDEKYFEAIERNISRYPDNLKNSSLLTLSVLTGHRVGIDDYVLYQKNKKIDGLKIASFDCEEFRTKEPSSLVAEDDAILNYCVRVFARHKNVSWVGWIEDLGWIEAPLNVKRSNYLRRLFQERNASPSAKTEEESS